ncbi:MAG: ABC transporter ATP-binding protein [Clostridia bacterium]|nr:ABC transporter ATP-binding protein [Clostridia bacterium]
MLEIKNLTKVYKGEKVAVDNLSLKVEKGDIFAFIGHNGAGKSTTIKSCVGLLDFSNGDVLIDGVSILKDPMYCKSVIAYIPDNPDIYEYMTGIAYLNFIADIFKVDKNERLALIDKYATDFEIKQNLGDLIGSYSHGMKQKIVIIAALLHKPKLMIMDEPFVGLDPKASFILKNMMTEMCKQGMAIFFSTHVLEVAEKLCNKVAIIKDGKLVVSGNTEDLVKDKSLEHVFMDSANLNINAVVGGEDE